MAAGLPYLVGIAELGALSAMFVVFIAHSLWVELTARPTQRRLAQLRQHMVSALGDQSPIIAPTSREDARFYRRALEELAATVSGAGAVQVEGAARELGLLDQAEHWCRSRWWWHRLRGVRLFGLLGGGGAIVPAHLGDTSPLVRAAAALWAVRHPSPRLAVRLIEMLDDPELRCRLAAKDALTRIGALASEPLAAYLLRASTSGRALALEVATGIADARFLEEGLCAAVDSDPAVRAQAATLLAAIAGDDAEQALLALLPDPSEPVRIAATHGLGVLGSWQVAPALARQLRDSAWDVRREAALALRRLGSAGRLYLRRALVDPDPYAADMARQVLDLPGTAVD